jgi:hypothetical protein
MERLGIELVSMNDKVKLFTNVRRALVCGFFMQVAHKEGEKGSYMTVRDNQVRWPAEQLWYRGSFICFLGCCTPPFVRVEDTTRMGYFQRVCVDDTSIYRHCDRS